MASVQSYTYSLSDYLVTIKLPDDLASKFGAETIQIGGEGGYTDSITLSRSETHYSLQNDATGGWVHVENKSKTGTIQISILQVTERVAQFVRLCTIYENAPISEYGDLTVTVTSLDGTTIATCNSCRISKIPDQVFGNTPAQQTWTLNCGQIEF